MLQNLFGVSCMINTSVVRETARICKDVESVIR